jgi:hypothetical protein
MSYRKYKRRYKRERRVKQPFPFNLLDRFANELVDGGVILAKQLGKLIRKELARLEAEVRHRVDSITSEENRQRVIKLLREF